MMSETPGELLDCKAMFVPLWVLVSRGVRSSWVTMRRTATLVSICCVSSSEWNAVNKHFKRSKSLIAVDS